MNHSSTRREFLHQLAGGGVLAAGLPRALGATDPSPNVPRVADHELTVISGKPRERGRQYGEKFKDAIHAFLDKEIVKIRAPTASRYELLRYAGQCTKAIQKYSPVIVEELEGMAEGSGLQLEELVLLTLHEEVAGHKKGQLPVVTH
jgi:hypothetical protein